MERIINKEQYKKQYNAKLMELKTIKGYFDNGCLAILSI